MKQKEFMHIWLKDTYLFGLKNIQNLKHLHGHLLITKDFGEMAEWFKAHAWKVCVPSQVPWVRIPLSPPKKLFINIGLFKCICYILIKKWF